MKHYLGIDGGGTRTSAAVSDENGNIILRKTGRSINFYSVGMETARKNLAEIVNALKTDTFEAVFIGCSALDNEADSELCDRLCRGIINSEKIRMNSDTYIALKSAPESECPCVAVCGTGSMAIAEDINGQTHIAGGWGHIIGDEGSAYAVAVRALKMCCILSDRNEDSALLRAANSFFGVNDFRKAIDIIYSPETSKDVIASFAEKVGGLADTGDKACEQILYKEAVAFADTVLTLLDKVGCCDLLGLYGGMFQHNEIFTNAFSGKVKERYPRLTIKLLDTPPEEGALELARKL